MCSQQGSVWTRNTGFTAKSYRAVELFYCIIYDVAKMIINEMNVGLWVGN